MKKSLFEEEELKENRSLRELYEDRNGLVKTFDNSMLEPDGSTIPEELFERHMWDTKTSIKTESI